MRSRSGLLLPAVTLLTVALAGGAVALHLSVRPEPPPTSPVVDGSPPPVVAPSPEPTVATPSPEPSPSPRATPSPSPSPRATPSPSPTVEVVEEVVEVAVAHGEQRRESDRLPEGESEVEAEGRDGLTLQTYRITLVDGEETERELVREEVVREPVDRVVVVGTGIGPIREAQQLLTDLGYPAGPVDGVDGPQTRRGLCTWRRLEGRDASRQSLQSGELEALRATSGLPAASAAGRGVTVDKTCQAVYYHQDGHWHSVHRASTGTGGLPRAGSYQIVRTWPGWHTSTLYPAPEPNMYNAMYFRGAIAIHGSNHVPPQPASSGCVRVTPRAADQLFGALGVGDPVTVIGSYG